MIIRSSTPLHVLAVVEETQRTYRSGFGPEAVFTGMPTGCWQVVLSGVTLRFSEYPGLVKGDEVYILVERKDDRD